MNNRVLSKNHFVGGNGPSENYPDPIQADGSHTMPARKLPVKRAFLQQNETSKHKYRCLHMEGSRTLYELCISGFDTDMMDIINGYVSSCN
ncbi:hypothetical protein CHS0354_039608 [Potamilus streckersoni]|uniref:Uncharacterized protein n=1 Tax=Potamilus streckersoni TaxID=2493646 RepID=A0AAE0RRM0_9BIVA|nr:hypothetical protein CHS0354_039608 [Potamilus streckersoni]